MPTDTGPPVPMPTIDEIRRMPADTEERAEARRIAARLWLAQFCARARYVLARTDLAGARYVDPRFGTEIDKCRSILPHAEVDAALRRES